ncbi:MAG: hypothetical protein J5441_00755 [Clostridia bacterium]|nr:hypothetical protein [Clostridia bacterium]
MERKVYFSRLLDFYGGLLPEKQRACMFQYYYDDLSLAEVSENLGITRQGVRDLIKRGEAALEKSEAELKLTERDDAVRRHAQALAAELSSLADELPAEFAGRVRALADSMSSWDV